MHMLGRARAHMPTKCITVPTPCMLGQAQHAQQRRAARCRPGQPLRAQRPHACARSTGTRWPCQRAPLRGCAPPPWCAPICSGYSYFVGNITVSVLPMSTLLLRYLWRIPAQCVMPYQCTL